MVKVASKLCPPVVFLLLVTLAGAQETDPKGPTLYGDGGGRIWKWSGGDKTWLSDPGRNLVLGGVGEDQLWGWSVEGDRARFFTQEIPQKKEVKEATDVEGGKTSEKALANAKEPPLGPMVMDSQSYPVPERADRVGDRRLLVWGARDGHPRYEVWKGNEKREARAWDDGRSVYALSLGRDEGWMIAGRTSEGLPWLELSGSSVPPPEGWRGRLTVAVWVPEKEDKKNDAKNSGKEPAKDAKEEVKTPPPVHPRAAGWGAPGTETPRPLFWGPEGWTQPDPGAEPQVLAGVYPVLGAAGEGLLTLAGWQADEGTGALRPWFWDGEAAEVPGGAADGQPQAFSAGGKGGAFLVVRHQMAPWFTQEDGKESLPLEGLGPEDRVVAVMPEASAAP